MMKQEPNIIMSKYSDEIIISKRSVESAMTSILNAYLKIAFEFLKVMQKWYYPHSTAAKNSMQYTHNIINDLLIK